MHICTFNHEILLEGKWNSLFFHYTYNSITALIKKWLCNPAQQLLTCNSKNLYVSANTLDRVHFNYVYDQLFCVPIHIWWDQLFNNNVIELK